MMARPKTPPKPYTKKEREYIMRVAGKVPLQLIAKTINRPESGVKQWASAQGIKLRVPREIMMKHWREYANTTKEM